MTLFSEIIPFTLPGSTGTFSVSHVQYPSETGKAAILVSVDTSGTNSKASYSFGVDDAVTHLGTGMGFTETFGVCLTARGLSNGYSLVKEQSQAFFGGYQVRTLGYVSAFHAGSVDITLDLNGTPGAQWYLVVIGGTDTLVKVVDYTSNDPGTQDCGFDPIALVKLDTTTVGLSENSGAAHTYGFAAPCHSKQAMWGLACAGASSDARSVELINYIDAAFNSGSTVGNSPDRLRTISSYPSNGFAVGGDSFVNGDFRLGVLAIGGSGVAANLVPIDQPSSTGAHAVSIDASSPKLVLLGSACLVGGLSTVQADGNVMFGAYDGVSQLSAWCGTRNGSVFPFRMHSRLSTTKAITMATATGAAASTVDADATVAFSASTLTPTWTTADATARQVWALVLADAISSPCGSGTVPTAHLIVTKATVPSPLTGPTIAFDFTTTGGLVPDTFQLGDGDSRTFDVTPGTYGVTETADARFITSYSVTGGASHTAVTLSNGQTKTIAVTNTKRYEPSGETVQWRLHRLDIKSRNEQTG